MTKLALDPGIVIKLAICCSILAATTGIYYLLARFFAFIVIAGLADVSRSYGHLLELALWMIIALMLIVIPILVVVAALCILRRRL